MRPVDRDIRREGRRWSHREFDQRTSQAPDKIEYMDGIFASDRQRLIAACRHETTYPEMG
jgi:hypothetical protein